jgi:arsenite methyltransferase
MNEKKIREQVSRDYARAVTASACGSCCCGSAAVPKYTVSKLAGYTSEELAALPPEAVVNSFGCGNPLAFSAIQPGQVVLDLGSGAGIDILLAAKKVGPTGRVIGVDMTDEMIAKARENIAAAGLGNAEVRKGLIEEMPVEDDSVDWVISNCVINLSPEKPRVFAEIARVLKPGGWMLVSDIVAEALPEEIRNDPALYSGCIAGAISETVYVQGLKDAGLANVEVVERLVYDQSQLTGFIGEEPAAGIDAPIGAEATGCCGGSAWGQKAQATATALLGRIWSAKFSAVKPGK